MQSLKELSERIMLNGASIKKEKSELLNSNQFPLNSDCDCDCDCSDCDCHDGDCLCTGDFCDN